MQVSKYVCLPACLPAIACLPARLPVCLPACACLPKACLSA